MKFQNGIYRMICSAAILLSLGLVSCGNDDVAKANVTVVEEQVGSQGQITFVPVAQATVKLYSNRQHTDHITTLETSGSSGTVSFEYPYEAILWVTATLGSRESSAKPVVMKLGETINEQVILPQ